MKHPALARVFSVVLAILGALLLYTGIRAFGENADEQAERRAYEDKLDGRIENYVSLHAELEGSADYERTMEAFKTFVTTHNRRAARHKTDTATYTATKGGLKMGEGLILGIQEQMDTLRQQLSDASSRKVFLEGLLSEIIASNKDRMPWLDTMANQAASCAVASYIAGARVKTVSEMLRALMEEEPSPLDFNRAVYTPPTPPEPLVLPGLYNPGTVSWEAMQAAYQSAAAAYMDAAAAWQQDAMQYAQDMQNYYDDTAQMEFDRLNGLRDSFADTMSDAAVSAEYTIAHAAWEESCKTVRRELNILLPKADLLQQSASLRAMGRQLRQLPSDWVQEFSDFIYGTQDLAELCEANAGQLDAYSGDGLALLSNEDFLLLTDKLEELFELLCDAFTFVATHLNNPASLIAEIAEKLHISELLVGMVDGRLKKAEQQMQTALAEMWYKLGELDKDALKLEAQKLGLDREAELLTKRTLDAETLKDLYNRHNIARQILVNLPTVREALGPDGDPEGPARAYLAAYRQETQRLRRGKLLAAILAVAGGVLGILAIPAAYELTKSRFLLLSPAIACFFCAAAVEGVHYLLGITNNYYAIFTAIFALVYLLIALPKKKKPAYSPKH